MLCVVAKAGSGVHDAGPRVDETDPGHLHAAEGHRCTAKCEEQFFLVGGIDDGFVALTQRGV